MLDASKEITKDGDVTDIVITNDGAWQRRCYSSFNCIVATISVDTGKVIDGEIMTRKCKSCEKHEKIKSSLPMVYESRKSSHKCMINHLGSAPSMEAEGTKLIFQRSVEKI